MDEEGPDEEDWADWVTWNMSERDWMEVLNVPRWVIRKSDFMYPVNLLDQQCSLYS